MTVGKRIRAARRKLGWTQTQLGDIVGLSKQAISGYEHGSHIPNANAIKYICLALKVSSDWLIGLTDDPKPRP